MDTRLLSDRLGMARVRLAVLTERERRAALTVEDQIARRELEERIADLERELGAQLELPGLSLLGPEELEAAR